LDRLLHNDCMGQSQDEGVEMKMWSNRLLKGFASVLAVGAIAAPGALGADLRSPDTQDAAKAGRPATPTDMSSPDTQDAAKAGRPATPTDMSSPDTQDAPKGRQSIQVITVAAPSRFDWIDAGIGAASGLGASLIGAGALLVVQRRRRSSVLAV
jgi:hypothetical protein